MEDDGNADKSAGTLKAKCTAMPFCPHFSKEHWSDPRGNWHGDCKGEWCCSAGGGFWRTGKFFQWLVMFVVWCVGFWLTYKFLQSLAVILLVGAHQVKESKHCSKVVKDGAHAGKGSLKSSKRFLKPSPAWMQENQLSSWKKVKNNVKTATWLV